MMKKCQVCGYENNDDSVYCMRCGKPLPESDQKKKEWFYVKDDKAHGPVSIEELKNLLDKNDLSLSSLIWKNGLDKWVHYYDSELFEYPEIKLDENNNKEWFYIQNEEKKGPVTDEELKEMVNNETLPQQALVWKVGLNRWIPFLDSELFQFPDIPENNEEGKIWFYSKDHRIHGPISANEIYDLVMSGQLNDRTGIWKYGMEDWVPYIESDIFELPAILDIKEDEPVEPKDGDWFYTDGKDEYGPFNEEQIKEFYQMGIIDDDTILWQTPDQKTVYKNVDFAQPKEDNNDVMEVTIGKKEDNNSVDTDKEDAPVEAEEIVEVNDSQNKESEPMILNVNDSVDWYIVENNESKGPFSEQDLLDMYHEGRIDDTTYVWHDLLEDWIYYKDSELAGK